jgi:myo-inositol-1-phosphate synthase
MEMPVRCSKLPKIKVALAGVGNCASALIQGLQYYSRCENAEESIGLRHLILGGFHPRDIQIVAAFDIDSRKVGKDLSEAIFALPNNAPKIVDVPPSNVIVQKGPVLDGVGEYTKNVVQISKEQEVDVAKKLKETGAEILLNLLPSGAVQKLRNGMQSKPWWQTAPL